MPTVGGLAAHPDSTRQMSVRATLPLSHDDQDISHHHMSPGEQNIPSMRPLALKYGQPSTRDPGFCSPYQCFSWNLSSCELPSTPTPAWRDGLRGGSAFMAGGFHGGWPSWQNGFHGGTSFMRAALAPSSYRSSSQEADSETHTCLQKVCWGWRLGRAALGSQEAGLCRS